MEAQRVLVADKQSALLDHFAVALFDLALAAAVAAIFIVGSLLKELELPETGDDTQGEPDQGATDANVAGRTKAREADGALNRAQAFETARPGAFATASKDAGGKLRSTGRFEPGQEVHVVVRLPRECANNKFRIDIVRSGGSDVLASHKFTWQEGWPKYSHGFALKDLAVGQYEARLYCINRLGLTSKFTVRKKSTFTLFPRRRSEPTTRKGE